MWLQYICITVILELLKYRKSTTKYLKNLYKSARNSTIRPLKNHYRVPNVKANKQLQNLQRKYAENMQTRL